MTDLEIVLDRLEVTMNKLHRIEGLLFNKLAIARIIDISDDKVHIVKQVIRSYETPDGVVVMIR